MSRLVNLIEKRLTDSWDSILFTNYEKNSFTGKDIYQKIFIVHKIFDEFGIKKGDKIALLGKNSGEWGIIFLATIVYGVIIVPILPDFTEEDIKQITNHSNVKLIFSSKSLIPNIPSHINVITIDDYQLFKRNEDDKYNPDFANKINAFSELKNIPQNKVTYVYSDENDLVMLSYTSGTSGFIKGVMISHKNLVSNIIFGKDKLVLNDSHQMLSFLPLAHSYGCMFEFLCPFCLGVRVHYLDQIPAPAVLIEAYQKIKPKLILLVPLVLEKIYKKRILPKISSPKIKLLLRIPGLRILIYKKIRRSLINTFGGNFFEIIIGGAGLNSDVENFLRKIKFPITVGYGLTECAPLVSYSHYYDFRPFSCGEVIDRMQVKIDSKDPFNIPGEILVKGDNVMLGYFKDPEKTKNAFDKNGWLKTGDLGVMDNDNVIYIKGRSKNMLLGPSGQNIYPEEIESKISNHKLVQECVVVDDKNHKLVALVYPDPEICKKNSLEIKSVEKILNQQKNKLNKKIPAYMHISRFVVVDKEFVKTPKKSIKRYLYTDYLK